VVVNQKGKEELFTMIAKYNLKLNPEKCVWGRCREVPWFLAYRQGHRG